MNQEPLTVEALIAKELQVRISQVEAAVRLIDDGATIPFIARYRKEATGSLDDTQLRLLADRLEYLRELNARRDVILKSIGEQGQLTSELEQSILAADTKNRLEDLYLPFKPKRRTKAQIAREAGLEPLAFKLLENPSLDPEEQAKAFLNAEKGIENTPSALDGARHILMEHFAENATLLDELREYLWQHAVIESTSRSKQKEIVAKYKDYFDYQEPIKKIPSHRALALFRGRREGALHLNLVLTNDPDYGENKIASYFNIADQNRPADKWLADTVKMAWKTKLLTKLELELLTRLRESADEEAIHVFARNLRGLLLAAPAGHQVTIGLDPGIRTGVKATVVDKTGKLLDFTTIYPFAPANEWHQSIAELAKLTSKYHVSLISIGNGTGSRETERLVADMIKTYPDLKIIKVIVNEAGASVYSASELAANEFPDLDVSLRGAVSIARRLQDPLAELVKIEPKSIGVGQYQHDVNQVRLARSLDGVVEDCVNTVGVDVNTASIPLLTHVAGLNERLAKNLVEHRDNHGAFINRDQLKTIPRMGEKTFQQAAGFLRIINGEYPLDASAVHPESYPLVEKIAHDQGVEIHQMIGNHRLLKSINAAHYVNEQFGLPTIKDVLLELEKPGRDPRPQFKTVDFKEGIESLEHLQQGMMLDGVVSNVTNFGAFINIGVHQDGLVHLSELADRFVSDPHAIIKAGDVVKVRVIDVDKERRRISLSMKLEETKKSTISTAKSSRPQMDNSQKTFKKRTGFQKGKGGKKIEKPAKTPVFNTAMADAFAKLKRGS